MNLKSILTVICVILFSSAYSQKTIIHCGNLIDGKANDVQPQMTLVVEGNKIIAVQKGFTKPAAGEKLIDLSKKTVLPGLIDMHVHLEGETSKDQALQRFTLNDADVAFRSTVFAKRTLMAGFTTVRDLGGSGVNVHSGMPLTMDQLLVLEFLLLVNPLQLQAAMPIQPMGIVKNSWATQGQRKV
jgi:imidazolonepropionase-like amidohydrolase